MKEKFNQMAGDKLFLVMLVLGLLTIVAAAGVITMQRGNGNSQNRITQEMTLAGESDVPRGTTNEQLAAKADELTVQQKTALTELPTKESSNETGLSDYSRASQETHGSAVQNFEFTEEPETAIAEAAAGQADATALTLDFGSVSRLSWPVVGNVLLDYSMDSTIYRPTLDQYQCNPGLAIQSEVGTPVLAPANARVTEAGTDDEIGHYLVLDLGNDYSVVCGQLDKISAVQGEYLEKGQVMGYVGEATKYYSVEGTNIYLELRHQDLTMDPLDYLE